MEERVCPKGQQRARIFARFQMKGVTVEDLCNVARNSPFCYDFRMIHDDQPPRALRDA